MAQSAFAKAFVNKAKKTFSQAKGYKHREGNSFGPADVPDGSYSAVITIDTSVPTKGSMEGIPIVRVKATINSGEHEGKEPSQSYFCEGKPVPSDPKEFPTAEQQLLGLLEWMLPDIEISEIEQVPDAIALINERGPICIVGVRNTENTETKKKYQNLYFNKLVKGASFDTEAASAVATDDEPTDVVEDDYVPAKGDIVSVEGDDDEWEVASVSQSSRTANLKSTTDDTGRKNRVPWTDLTLV